MQRPTANSLNVNLSSLNIGVALHKNVRHALGCRVIRKKTFDESTTSQNMSDISSARSLVHLLFVQQPSEDLVQLLALFDPSDDLALPVDQNLRRQAVYFEHLHCDRHSRLSCSVCPQRPPRLYDILGSPLRLPGEFRIRFLIRAERLRIHADDLEALAFVLLVEFLQVRNIGQAGLAPSGPEIQQHEFSAKLGKLTPFARKIYKIKLNPGLARVLCISGQICIGGRITRSNYLRGGRDRIVRVRSILFANQERNFDRHSANRITLFAITNLNTETAFHDQLSRSEEHTSELQSP